MRLFGFEISRAKAQNLLPVSSSIGVRNSFWAVIRESFAGAWQRDEELKVDTGLSNPTLFRCVTLIATDVAKMMVDLVQYTDDGIWTETENTAYSPVLRKPNDYQNRIQFFTCWLLSKLLHGNAYVLKGRDNRQVVTRMWVLDPCLVTPLVSDDGAVFYQLQKDLLSEIDGSQIIVPASEIIHDRTNTFFHPLVGLSPIFACGLAALEGVEIQRASTKFFKNGSRPSGILTAPGAISDETAARLKTAWETNYGGENYGRTAILGDGLKYEAMVVPAQASQLIEQLRWSAETICGVFGVPAYMAGVGPAPLNNNVEALVQQYYGQCLQIYIESLELCLDEGLELKKPYGTQFNLDDLLRMDTAARIDSSIKSIGGALTSTNEERRRFNKKPIPGGDDIRAQQQQFSLAALAERDQNEPFSKPDPAPAAPPANDNMQQQAAAALDFIKKEFAA